MPPFFNDVQTRLELLLRHNADIKSRIESASHEPLYLFILEASRGHYDEALWKQLTNVQQEELLQIQEFAEPGDASRYMVSLLDGSWRAEPEQQDDAMPDSMVQNLHRKITSLVARQQAVGDKIVALAPQAKLYRFLKEAVGGNIEQCRKLFHELDSNFRQELMAGQDLPEGPLSDEFLLRIIDPSHHIPLRGAASSSPAAHVQAASVAAPPVRWNSSGYPRGDHPEPHRDQWASSSSYAYGWRERGSSWGEGNGSSWTEGWNGMSHLESVSRKLSLVLRHDTKLPVRPDGFCKLSEVLSLRRFQDIGCTEEDVKQVVDGAHESGNSKQRFQTRQEGDELLIRANQGYSRKDILAESAYKRLLLEDPNLPDPCIHGTYNWHWNSILERGLLAGGLQGPQGRNEIHFACEDPTGGTRRAISGMRSDCDLAIWLDVRKAIEDGLPFYISDNGVILSPGDENGSIASRYFLKAMDISRKPPRQLWPMAAQ